MSIRSLCVREKENCFGVGGKGEVMNERKNHSNKSIDLLYTSNKYRVLWHDYFVYILYYYLIYRHCMFIVYTRQSIYALAAHVCRVTANEIGISHFVFKRNESNQIDVLPSWLVFSYWRAKRGWENLECLHCNIDSKFVTCCVEFVPHTGYDFHVYLAFLNLRFRQENVSIAFHFESAVTHRTIFVSFVNR